LRDKLPNSQIAVPDIPVQPAPPVIRGSDPQSVKSILSFWNRSLFGALGALIVGVLTTTIYLPSLGDKPSFFILGVAIRIVSLCILGGTIATLSNVMRKRDAAIYGAAVALVIQLAVTLLATPQMPSHLSNLVPMSVSGHPIKESCLEAGWLMT
jgi:hypothetical protein